MSLTTGRQGFSLSKNGSPLVKGPTSRIRAKLLGLDSFFVFYSGVNFDTQLLVGGLIWKPFFSYSRRLAFSGKVVQ